MTDAHAHLTEDLSLCADAIAATHMWERLASLKHVLQIHLHRWELDLFAQASIPTFVLETYGIYPESTPQFGSTEQAEYLEALNLRPIVAIGECGIDLHGPQPNLALQEAQFRFQIELAIERRLPLIVHTRDAFQDTYRILRDYPEWNQVVIHCFSYGVSEADAFLHAGYMLSFAGNLTYKKALNIQDAARLCPSEQLLCETDSPYLSPVPFRGKRNFPTQVAYTTAFLSEIREQEMEGIVDTNFERLFGLA